MTQTVAPAGQPDALEHFDDIIARMAGRSPALFLDYDGTLVPLARRPELAIAPPGLLKALSRLADLMPVAVVTGRGRPDVMQMLGVKGIAYAGSHGFDIVDAEGTDLSGDIGDAFLPALKKASLALTALLDPIDGAFLEDKIYSLAIHYREVAEDRHAEIEAAVKAEADRHPTLKKAGGKMIHELRPDMEWNKGTAILHVMEAMGLTPDTSMPFYIGDDETDEDGFNAVRDIGVGIKVGGDMGETAAHFTLQSPDAVGVFLSQLTDSHSQ
ncbi:trehalose-phosphatase [Pyruvatibacter sp.]|uniref:trehalose-phosphatase n=1 Tax=Pyruvatibacter sp. TaxID=1981328 RepID=UPI003267AEA2